ncbi:hypothetical protein JCM14469_25120 [Desulfatiferula olefinivorans]
MKKRTLAAVVAFVATVILFIWVFSHLQNTKSNPAGSGDTAAMAPEKALPSLSFSKDLAFDFSPAPGEVLSYRFVLKSDTELASDLFSISDPKAPSSSRDDFVHLMLNTSGNLFLKFYHPKRPGEDLNVACIIEDVRLTLNDKTPDYAKALAFPFAVQMDAKGYLNDFVFTAGVPEQAAIMIKTILYAMQTVYPKEKKTTWQTREIDASGQYLAEYRLTDGENEKNAVTVEKKKTAYTLLLNKDVDMAEGLAPTGVRIETSRIVTRLPITGAWIAGTEQMEVTDIMTGTKKLGRSTTRFSAERRDKAPASAFAGTFDEALSTLYSPAYLKEKYRETDPELSALSANFDLDAALAAFRAMRESLTTADRLNAEKFMINYLRQNPEACYDLIRMIDADAGQSRFDHDEQLELWRLITKAGHDDAQRAMLEAIGNTAYSDLTHIRALAYIHDFEYPQPFVADGLWHFYNSVDMIKGNDTARELGSMSLYAIGSLGSDEKLNQALKPVIGKSLVDNLQRADDPSVQVMTLQAIGNYGGADAMDGVKPYFTSPDEHVRIAAYEAIRRMPGDTAFDAFKTHYSAESSQKVRTSALKILESMPATGESIAWAGREVLTVNESQDQESLVKVLGQNMDGHPQSEAALRELLAQKPSNLVKKTVYRYITP